MARKPTKFTKTNRERILGAIRAGVTKTRACTVAGDVSRRMCNKWLEQGKLDLEAGKITTYAQFYLDFEAAEDEALGQLEQRVYKASANDWRAATWMLDRRDRGTYGDVKPEDYSQFAVMATQIVKAIHAGTDDRVFHYAFTALKEHAETHAIPFDAELTLAEIHQGPSNGDARS